MAEFCGFIPFLVQTPGRRFKINQRAFFYVISKAVFIILTFHGRCPVQWNNHLQITQVSMVTILLIRKYTPSYSTVCGYFLSNLIILLPCALCPFIRRMRHGKNWPAVKSDKNCRFHKRKSWFCLKNIT